MNTRFLTSAFVAFAALATAWVAPVKAHHSFAAEFDGTKPITLKGTVTQIDWANADGKTLGAASSGDPATTRQQ